MIEEKINILMMIIFIKRWKKNYYQEQDKHGIDALNTKKNNKI
jgi:hypothetical protein